ncbi:hypothetical protein CEE37_01270 [candidate division LCP-89 bacterium B3_LCP]|uniref:Polymerase/histidinol phosphatase N-terminal domain-containing protein n=1 Tax=candidate division LCP-89 bacterium B3_LCP TaxID=2012998 RepID=A0A532V577_UNCL8|nr:MAG: hypothetical protein CEE37_01270 [candidate division LCP-89 bacterium B3_LCP]
MTPVDLPPEILPLVVMYPEVHYRFRALPISRYFIRQPEIIADAPHRIEPGQPLPVLLVIKDADRFPVLLQGVNLDIQGKDTYYTHHVNFGQEMVSTHWWHHIEWVDLPDEAPCEWTITPTWRIQLRGKYRAVGTDNLAGLSHKPLQVFQASDPLPRKEGWVFGDFHVHTAYTEDQIEFGAPLPAYPALGKAMGLSFVFASDHSYDLDDVPGSFTEADPNLIRFKQMQREIVQLNAEKSGEFVFIPGYELSAANSRGKNVHLLLVNQKDFLPGSGDSAERWLHRKAELTISEALAQMKKETLAVAAHPKMKAPLLERLLLGRGHWGKSDLEHESLFGLQVWNGGSGKDFQRGLKIWTKGLLEGKRWKLLAGSDAHGNFNRYRQVGIPMLYLTESDRQLFGKVRTGIRIRERLDLAGIMSALREDLSLVTDGPFAELSLKRINNNSISVNIAASSSSEFGELEVVKLFWGAEGEPQERIHLCHEDVGGYDFSIETEIPKPKGYVRIEVQTNKGCLCLTNPEFIEVQSQ